MTRLLLLLTLTSLVACAGDDLDATDGTDTDVSSDTDTDTDGPDLAAGARVFDDNCTRCHGADGSGGSGPDLSERAPSLDAARVKETVLNGKNYMPAIEITDREATDVAAFVIDKHG